MNKHKRTKRNKKCFYPSYKCIESNQNQIYEKKSKYKYYYEYFEVEYGKASTKHEQNMLVICQDCYPIILEFGIEYSDLCSWCG